MVLSGRGEMAIALKRAAKFLVKSRQHMDVWVALPPDLSPALSVKDNAGPHTPCLKNLGSPGMEYVVLH